MAERKVSWRQRVNPKLVAVIVVPLILIALWWVASKAGSSFGSVLQIDLGQVASVTVSNSTGRTDTYAERGDIEAVVEKLRSFRYTERVPLTGTLEMLGGIQFTDGSGQCICSLGLGRGAILTEDNTLYMGDENYFNQYLD